MRLPIIIVGWPFPRLYIWWHGRWHRIHHVWLALIWGLTDVADWRVWVSDLRNLTNENPRLPLR